jgi:hypothetical protein
MAAVPVLTGRLSASTAHWTAASNSRSVSSAALMFIWICCQAACMPFSRVA